MWSTKDAKGPSQWLAKRLGQDLDKPSTKRGKLGPGADLGDTSVAERAQPITAASVMDGTALQAYADHLVAKFSMDTHVTNVFPQEPTYSTMCSGSDISKFALEAVGGAIRKHTGRPFCFTQLWACEKDGLKKQWLADLHNRSVCIFGDSCHVAKKEAYSTFTSGSAP